MALRLDDLPDRHPEVPGLEVRRVRTTAQLESWANVTASNWTPPDPGVLSFYRRTASASVSPARLRDVREHHGVQAEGRTPMIRKLADGRYRLYSRKKDPKTGKRRNLGTFASRAAAEKHERAVQYFKRRG